MPNEYHGFIRSKTITTSLLQYLLSDQVDEVMTDSETHFIQILDAFTPDKLIIEKSKGGEITIKRVNVKEENESKFGEASDAISMYRQQYQNIFNLLNNHSSIISSSSLLGTKGLCQIFCRLGRANFDSSIGNIFWAEDLDGKFRVDLSKIMNKKSNGYGIFCVGSFIIMNGEYNPDEKIFIAHDISLPDLDLNKIKQLKRNYRLSRYGLSSRQVENIIRVESELQKSEFIVILQDIHLDDPNVIRRLTILFEEYSKFPPALFVLIGSFTSKDHQHFSRQEYRSLFQNLALIIANGNCKNLIEDSMFVFVPGPNDATLTADTKLFPRASIPNYYIKPLKDKLQSNVHFTSNPCHIRFLSNDIAIYRDDLLQKLMRNAVAQPSNDQPLHVHLSKTLYSSAHLAPLDQLNHPVFWKYDHSMRLVPFPDTVIIADRSSSFQHVENGIPFLNPSSFSKNYSFIEFSPIDNVTSFKKL